MRVVLLSIVISFSFSSLAKEGGATKEAKAKALAAQKVQREKLAGKGKPVKPTETAGESCNEGALIETIFNSPPACLEELKKAMKGANKIHKIVKKESTVGQQTVWTWEVETMHIAPAPSFSQKPVAKLVIDWKSEPEDENILDKPTTWMKNCRTLPLGKLSDAEGATSAQETSG